MWERLEVEEELSLHDAILLVSVSTTAPQYRALYSQARELANYMLRKMEFRRFATLYSSGLPPAVVVSEDGTARLISNGFYHHSGRREIVVFAGDGSPTEEQYEYAHSVLSFAQKVGVKEVISIGSRWTEAPEPQNAMPQVLGFSTDPHGVAQLQRNGVAVIKSEPAPFFTSLVVGIAEDYGMRGYKLAVNHGEPSPHPRSLVQFLAVLTKMAQFEIDVKELEDLARELDKAVPPSSLPEMPRERSGVYG